MASRIFVTGGSGFVGSAVVEELLKRGYEVVALSHHGDVPGARVVRGDVFDRDVLAKGMAGCSAVVHLIGIILEKPSAGVTFERLHTEATRRVVEAAKAAGVRRYVQMSAIGARADAASDYHRTKWEAEECVRESGLDWTIIRPSMIHGPKGEFTQMEAGWARGQSAPWVFMPYFGAGLFGQSGAGRLQPVYVKDVARAFADAIERPQTIGQVYELGGSGTMTWPEMHHTASEAIVGRQRAAVAIPAWYAKFLTRVVPGGLLPFNRDQVIMSQENNTCDLTHFRQDFGWEPAGFAETLDTYAKQL